MGQTTKIQWTDHTFNPVIGCSKVSPGCDHCYAEALDKRWARDFEERRRTSQTNWRQPLKWNAEALAAGIRRRVFCASLADVFDAKWQPNWRLELFSLIRQTPQLDWQLLTKRPEFIIPSMNQVLSISVRNQAEYITSDDGFKETRLWLTNWLQGKPPPNVWLGVSVENQEMADRRINRLFQVPAMVRFLSCEPLLGPVDLFRWLHVNDASDAGAPAPGNRLHWVIVGGESGPPARPMDLTWARGIQAQCKEAGVACFMKQLGDVPLMPEAEWNAGDDVVNAGDHGVEIGHVTRVLKARNRKKALPGTVPIYLSAKGGEMSEWPVDLQVRQFPEVSHG